MPQTYLQMLTSLSLAEWKPIRDAIISALQKPMADRPGLPCFNIVTKPDSWQRWDGVSKKWVEHDIEDFNQVVTIDFEATKQVDGTWMPSVCGAYDGRWFFRFARLGEKVFPFPSGRVIIGQNSASYDRRYLSSEYALDTSSYFLDTMQLGNIMHGMSDEDDNEIYQQWRTFEKMHRDGKGVPQWHSRISPLGLEELVGFHLGTEWAKKIDKTIRDEYVADPSRVSARTLVDYCLTDVEVTHQLASVLFPKVSQLFCLNPITWLGMGTLNNSKYYLKDWQDFQAKSEAEYQNNLERLLTLREKLIGLADQKDFPALEWDLFKSGKNKGRIKWVANLTESPFSSATDIQLLRLQWQGKPITYKPGAKTANWWAEIEGEAIALPHPTGDARLNLGTPLCKDYRGYAESGMLSSAILPQEKLVKMLDILGANTQWTAYRKRYATVYSQPLDSSSNIDISVADFNGCGTVSRRAKSPLWVVLPKENDNKIGSQVMDQIVAPPGYKLVSADFVSQESRIAVMLADTKAGRHGSCEWAEAVLNGNKSLGTDCHTMTSKRVGTSRRDAKDINFLLQYGGGLQKLITYIRLSKGCSLEEATQIGTEFMVWYNKIEVAGSIKATLSNLTSRPSMRTYLLGVKCPDTLDASFVPDRRRSFITTRNNWHIQSAGQDELHTLIFLIQHFARKAGLTIYFACAIHDQVSFFVRDEDTKAIAEIFDVALEKLMQFAYQTAFGFWNAIDPDPARKCLQPLPHWLKFESVEISNTISGKNL